MDCNGARGPSLFHGKCLVRFMSAAITGFVQEKNSDSLGKYTPRMVMIAYCCDPHGTMEERNGWHRALIAAEQFETTVIYRPLPGRASLAMEIEDSRIASRLRFIAFSPRPITEFLLRREGVFYIGYRRWLHEAFRTATELHREAKFDIAHTTTLCGFREPGELWRLGVPHVWGPIGGTQDLPKDFHSAISSRGRIREWVRSLLNGWHLKYRKRVRKAVSESDVVIAATEWAREDIGVYFQRDVDVELETGLDYELPEKSTFHEVGQPLKILWAGRLREWKGLPLLLHALAKLRSEGIPFELRILGVGSSRSRWMKIAQQLKIDGQIEWIESCSYRIGIEHYRWADVFVFTSLRDTSGTGLLDALAAGTPIVGLGHQGAADIITPDCGIAVSVERPSQTISEIAFSLSQLSRNSSRLRELSLGATMRAKSFHWDQRREYWRRVYTKLMTQHRGQAVASG
ncbi:MAG: glycosyltransferase family 4 protein [Planctomycetes bacterium]|nr:glycosyltransferase family 4 protein [Planctomycetota bacterium]